MTTTNPVEQDGVVVPRAVFDWLMGENGDFECAPEHYFRGSAPPYWWRSELRRRIAAAPQHETGELPEPAHRRWPDDLPLYTADQMRAYALAARDQALGECFVLAGGDTDGGDPARCAHRAVEVVRDLRECYEERGRELAATEQALAEARRDGERLREMLAGCGVVLDNLRTGRDDEKYICVESRAGSMVNVAHTIAAIEREQEKG